MLPFPSPMLGASTVAGGSGGAGNLRTVVGNANMVAGGGAGNSTLAQLVRITTPAGPSSVLSAVQVGFSGFGSQSLKALLYADVGGEPSGSPIAIGNASTPGASGANPFLVSVPFVSALTLPPSTSYWVGFVASASVPLVDAGSFTGNAAGRSHNINYSAPGNWDNTTDAVTVSIMIWAVLQQNGAATGLHQQGSSGFFAGTGSAWLALPPHAIGDRVIISLGQWFGTVPTISGFTQYVNNGHTSNGGVRHVLFERVIDGTEGGVFGFVAPGGNERSMIATVFRGGGAREGGAFNAGVSTSATSAAVTTAGANRRVFNFLAFGQGGSGISNTDTADSWTDVYNVGSLANSDMAHSLSYKDQAAAGSAGTETRAVSSSWWMVTSYAVPDV